MTDREAVMATLPRFDTRTTARVAEEAGLSLPRARAVLRDLVDAKLAEKPARGHWRRTAHAPAL